MSNPLVSAADLALMRDSAQLLMPESWSLVHPTNTQDAQGNAVTWAVTASGTQAQGTGGRLMPAGYQAAEFLQGGRVEAIGAWTITLPSGTPVMAQDRIIIGTALTIGAAVTWTEGFRAFEVTGTSAGHTYESAVKVACDEVK